MTVFQVATGRLSETPGTGLRPFDIGKDLRPVAELIADAFAHELDPNGNAALREMRIMSHVGGFLKLLNRGTGEFDDFFGGFVWQEEDRVVGNVTVQRMDSNGNRWQIANVAVAPPYRGKGIASRLMRKALDHIVENGGQWAVLQVYERNSIARHLYDRLGFEVMGGNVDLYLAKVPKVTEYPRMPNFYSFANDQWQALYDLANRQYSAQVQWWRSLRRTDFQLTFEQQLSEWFWRMVGRNHVYRRCIQTYRNQFDAALILTVARWKGIHQLQLWAHPEQYGRHEAHLLQWTLATLQNYPRWPVQVSLSRDHTAALSVAQEYGFSIQNTLLTLRRKI
jgi:ribosomal protein S18 acetylase RimI-like enzyme